MQEESSISSFIRKTYSIITTITVFYKIIWISLGKGESNCSEGQSQKGFLCSAISPSGQLLDSQFCAT